GNAVDRLRRADRQTRRLAHGSDAGSPVRRRPRAALRWTRATPRDLGAANRPGLWRYGERHRRSLAPRISHCGARTDGAAESRVAPARESDHVVALPALGRAVACHGIVAQLGISLGLRHSAALLVLLRSQSAA